MSREGLLQIGDVAERVDLSLRTVRYYEEVGLVTPSARSEGGFRLYSHHDVERLLLIKQMRPLGLTLEQIGELVDLIERSELPARLEKEDLHHVAERLRGYADRADAAIEKVEREMGWARQLRIAIGDRLGRCEATLEQTSRPQPT